MVFVLDRKKHPLMPCSERRARLLLKRGRAVVHRLRPFTIRLKDRLCEVSTAQPVVLKIDPGSQVTGIALVREESRSEGALHHALFLAQVRHRGEAVRERLRKRAAYRRRRRSANLRHRQPRFRNRTWLKGWLAPSLRSRVDNVLHWAQRSAWLTPVVRVEIELVRFDTQALQRPEISGIEYQRGELFGYEVREYLLEKWGRRCAYCGAVGVPLQIEHIVPRSRRGSSRISNLAIACKQCNHAKGQRTAGEFGHPEVQSRARVPLRDAAATNTTRRALTCGLRQLGFAVRTWSGGRTKWNRTRFGLAKTHPLDALCVGELCGVTGVEQPVLTIRAWGRGQRSRTSLNAFGFPRAYRMRGKRVHGFRTGDLVQADTRRDPQARTHIGRVVVRASGWFRVDRVNGSSWRNCRLLQRGDGYGYEQESCSDGSTVRLAAGAATASQW